MYFPDPAETAEILASKCAALSISNRGDFRDKYKDSSGTLLSMGIKLLSSDFGSQDYTIFVAETDLELTLMLADESHKTGGL